ncbi:hypothetical protein SEVIR_6G166425v4 [Setaria viridis]
MVQPSVCLAGVACWFTVRSFVSASMRHREIRRQRPRRRRRTAGRPRPGWAKVPKRQRRELLLASPSRPVPSRPGVPSPLVSSPVLASLSQNLTRVPIVQPDRAARPPETAAHSGDASQDRIGMTGAEHRDILHVPSMSPVAERQK